jgi:diguanylate cyclase
MPDGRVVASNDDDFRPHISQSHLERLADGQVHEFTTSEQAHVLGAVHALPHDHFSLIVEAPFDVAFAPVLSVVSRIFVSDLAIILIFSFLAYKITATIMRPIRSLSEGARRISRGDFDHAIPDAPASDEIGLLIRTFNDMLAQLRRNAAEIEDDQRRLTAQNEELQRANEVLAQLSITDGLTKLHNHRYFQDHLTREIKRIGRTGEALSMILMDLDDFKRLNDMYGHSAGDELLVGVANILVESVRESDLLARYGGEEFVILATGTNLEGAISMAEKIRMSVESSSHIVDDSMRPIRVTISIGVATFDGDRRAFFQAADRALYDAKAQGKNCVVAAPMLDELDSA